MAFREVTMLEVKEVLRLWLLGVPKKRIAEQLGFDVKTVRRYLGVARARGVDSSHGLAALDDELVTAVVAATQPAAGRPRGEGWAVCEAHRELISGHLTHRVRLSKVAKLLRRRGVEIGYDTLRRYAMEQLGFGTGAPTVPVADCAPGQELQLDTGWMTLLEPDLFGKRRRFKAWIFTAVLSRHRFVYPVFQETTATAIEACEAAWEYYGGVFHVLIPDNTKAIVAAADPIAPRITDGFREYAGPRLRHRHCPGPPPQGQGPRRAHRADRPRRLLRRRAAAHAGGDQGSQPTLGPGRVRDEAPRPHPAATARALRGRGARGAPATADGAL
jgi:transposase